MRVPKVKTEGGFKRTTALAKQAMHAWLCHHKKTISVTPGQAARAESVFSQGYHGPKCVWPFKRSLDKVNVSERINWRDQIMTLVLERLKVLALE